MYNRRHSRPAPSTSVIDVAAHAQWTSSGLHASVDCMPITGERAGEVTLTWPRVHARLLQFSGRSTVTSGSESVWRINCSAASFNAELTSIVAPLNGRSDVLWWPPHWQRPPDALSPSPQPRRSLKNGLNEWAWWRAGTLLALYERASAVGRLSWRQMLFPPPPRTLPRGAAIKL